MSSELLILVEVLVVFGSLLLVSKFLKKEGLIVWVSVASVLANIFTTKTTILFGDENWSYALGSVLFASTFLATDILTELYGSKVAKKAVIMGAVSSIILIITSQIALTYTAAPWSTEVQAGMESIFSLSLRISISSVVMYIIANLADIYIYDKIKVKTGGKHMWLRNNVSTIVCNCLENFFFMFGAFLFVPGYDVSTIVSMALTVSAVEAFVGMCDTPFLYLATKWNRDKVAIA